MEYIRHKFHQALDLLRPYRSPPDLSLEDVDWRHVYLEHILRVISWKNWQVSLQLFIVLQVLLWCLNAWHCSVLSLIAMALLNFVMWNSILYETLLGKYTGEYEEVIEEIFETFRLLVKYFRTMRRENKLSFTCWMSLLCLACLGISMNMSGYYVLLTILVIIFAAPNIIIRSWALPEWEVRNSTRILAEDELIPYITNKDFASAVDAELESLLTDRTAESVSNSFASGISAMPSYTEVVDTDSIVIAEDDLMPRYDSVSRGRTPSDSDSDNNKHDLSFESDHFKSSSSSEDDNVDGVKQRATSDRTNTWLLNVASMGNALMSNLVNRPSQEQASSSESDFEILDPDEIED